MKRFLAWFVALVLAFVACACQQGDDSYRNARAYQVTSRAQLIGGPKAAGSVGDYILENERIRVLINGHATDVNTSLRGGAIIDADIVRQEDAFSPARGGNDRFVELIPVFDVKLFGIETIPGSGPVARVEANAIKVLNDGSDGGAAEIRVEGVLTNIISLLKFLPVPLSMLPVKAEVTYRLAPGKAYVEINSKYTLLNKDGSQPAQTHEVPLRPITAQDNVISSLVVGAEFGDAVFFGDSLDMIGPGVFGFSSSFYISDQAELGRSTFTNPPLVDWTAGVSSDIGYGLVAPDAPLSFPLMESFLTLALQMVTVDPKLFPGPGSTYSHKRYFVVAEGDAAGVLDEVIKIRQWAHGRIEGRVISEGQGQAMSGVQVLVFKHPRLANGDLVPLKPNYEEMNQYLTSFEADAVNARRLIPYSRFTTDSHRLDAAKDGDFGGNLPVAEAGDEYYLLMASGPGNVHTDLVPVHLNRGGTKSVMLVLPAAGKIMASVRSFSERGPQEPVKVTFIGENGEGRPNPYLGEGFLPAEEAKIVSALNGRGEAVLPAGTYRVVASRGPEYTTDEQLVTIGPMETRKVDLTIERVVDSSGWIAGDFHMHSQRSPDSGMSIEARVTSALVEGLDVVASTDHDFVTNYVPALESLGMSDWLVTLAGDELSQLHYGHFNAFPLSYDQTQASGGAPNWRDPSPTASFADGSPLPLYAPQDCFDSLRARGDRGVVGQDPIVIMNHSQESMTGYLRSFGFEQYYGTFGAPDFMTFGDPVVHNGRLYSLNGENTTFSWDFDAMELLNGKRWDDFRTATVEESREGVFGQPTPADMPLLPTYIRTASEQKRILSGDLLLDDNNRGMIDDFMTLQAMGHRVAGLGGSDSHNAKKEENGKVRVYVMSSADDPRFLDVNELITNMKAGRAIVSTGPFMELWVDGYPIASDVYNPTGTINVRIRAQAPPWMSFDRIELYGNGILIGEIGQDRSDIALACDTSNTSINDADQVIRFDDTVKCHVDGDTFIMAIGIGYNGMTPVSNRTDGPAFELTDTLILGVNSLLKEWLGLGNLIPMDSAFERNHEIYPFVVTNPVWVDTDGYDADGDGFDYDGPGGIPGWFDEKDITPDQLTAASLTDTQQAAVFAAYQRILSMSSLYDALPNANGGEADEANGAEPDDWQDGGCGG